MSKQEFLAQLRKGLSGLPQAEIEERLSFYSEMIDDQMEEGLSEEAAVHRIGNVDALISQIVAEIPHPTSVKEKKTPKKRLNVLEIVLLVLGSPIWLSLLIAAFAVILSLYALLWSVVVSIWAVFASLVGCGLGGIAAGIVVACNGNVLTGIAVAGTGIVCAGLSVFMFCGCKGATKGASILTKKVIVWIKRCFIQKEEA